MKMENERWYKVDYELRVFNAALDAILVIVNYQFYCQNTQGQKRLLLTRMFLNHELVPSAYVGSIISLYC